MKILFVEKEEREREGWFYLIFVRTRSILFKEDSLCWVKSEYTICGSWFVFIVELEEK